MQSTQTCPGPGDSVTWGQPTGHPLDPRTDDDDRLEYFKCKLGSDPEVIRDICGSLPESVWDEWATKFALSGSESAADVLADAVFAEVEARAISEEAKANEQAANDYAADRHFDRVSS